jgi:hypothetical protein
MYNIHSHYQTIFHALSSIVTHRRLLYLHPYGSTQPENIENIADNLDEINAALIRDHKRVSIDDGPLFIFYDQEPIYGKFNHTLFDHIRASTRGPFILVTTEKSSDALDAIQKRYSWPSVYYFHHAFAAHDWFRGYRYDSRLIPPKQRNIKKKYITFNRLTSHSRVYRSLLLSELVKHRILDQGYVSYNDVCPENNQNFIENLTDARDNGLIGQDLFLEAVDNISQCDFPLRIDYKDRATIPNHSFVLSAVEETQESFCYLVTETCYWERKHHLTEKIFKPIVSRMPFVLAGPAHNLKYLREYGFKTFSKWFDESYDDIEDPLLRLQAIGNTMREICSYSESQLEDMLVEMTPVLEHNYQRFYSNEFLDHCWRELITNLNLAVNEF